MKINEGIIVRSSKKGKAYHQLMVLSEQYFTSFYAVKKLVDKGLRRPDDLLDLYSEVFMFILQRVKVGTSEYDKISTSKMEEFLRQGKEDLALTRNVLRRKSYLKEVREDKKCLRYF